MRYIRVWADERGESHMETAEMGFNPAMAYAAGIPAIDVSVEHPALNVHFLRLAPGWEGDWHPAPRRQFMLMVSGFVESETCDGASGRLGPGDVALLEDTTGRGHRTCVIGDEPVVMMVGVLDDGA